MRARLEHGVPQVARLGHDLDVVLGLEHAAETRTDDGMVVDDEHADRHEIGTSIESVVPEPAVDSTSSRPPTSATRSLHPEQARGRRAVAARRSPAVVLDHRGHARRRAA